MGRRHSNDLENTDENSKQAVSLARRMAGKKGAVVQLQTEVNTEEDWTKLLTKQGLIVVDVYSDWCGPCVGMVGNLKKCKLEMGGDDLHLAIAKSDEIGVLKRFTNKSEPTWMFISQGKLLHVLFGANAPRLMQMIESELKIEKQIREERENNKKELKREDFGITYEFDQLTPEEEERAAKIAQQRAEEAKEAAARELAAKNEEKDHRFSQMINQLISETVVVLLTHIAEGEEVLHEVETALNQVGVNIVENVKVTITPEMWEDITYRETLPYSLAEVTACLEQGPCLALLVKCLQYPPISVNPPEKFGDIEKLVWETLCLAKLEDGKPAIPQATSIPARYSWVMKTVGVVDELENDESVKNQPAKKDQRKSEKQQKGKEESRTSKSQSSVKVQEASSEVSEQVDDKISEISTTPIPGILTPISPYSKCSAVTVLFPARANRIVLEEMRVLPPRLVLVFETAKANECFALVEEMKEDVISVGFFDKGDPDEAQQIAKNQEEYSKASHSAEDRLIIVVVNSPNEPALDLIALGPLYVSPNDVIGSSEADKFFPHREDTDLPEEGGEESKTHDVND